MLSATPALAMEVHETDAPAGDFGKPTSVPPVQIIGGANPYITDVSKNAALIPPAFGSPSADVPCTGEPLTPDLAGGAITPTYPSGGGSVSYPTTSTPAIPATAYTAITSDLYYIGGHLGTLSIPTLGLTVKVYEGTDSDALRKGAGHFNGTSIWDGNVAIAGHNRGVNNHFGQIHTLDVGDRMTLTTKLGTRSYTVCSVRKVSVSDSTVLDATAENTVTLITCVRNQPEYRWCVQAKAQ